MDTFLGCIFGASCAYAVVRLAHLVFAGYPRSVSFTRFDDASWLIIFVVFALWTRRVDRRISIKRR